MARIRTIKPDFFKNEDIAELPAMVRLLFIGLWTQADREGRLQDRPKRLKIELFPYDNIDIDKCLNELQEAGFILRYKVDLQRSAPEQSETKQALIQINNFLKHQQPNVREQPSTLPVPYKDGASTLGREGEQEGEQEMNLIKIGHDKFFNRPLSSILEKEYRQTLDMHMMGSLKNFSVEKVLQKADLEYPSYDFKDKNHLSNAVKGLGEKILKEQNSKTNGTVTSAVEKY